MNRKLGVSILAAATIALIGGAQVGLANAGGKRGGDGNHDHSDNPVAAQQASNSGNGNGTNGLKILGDRCKGNSNLKLHNGFQSAAAVCVNTEFGEQSAFEKNPTLLIVEAPTEVEVGADIVLKISTQNLIRDRFLAAGQGGYYLESAFLRNGFTRGHFHTGCRKIGNTAPEPFRLDNRFVATEDGKGGGAPDTVTVTIPGFSEPGLVQCASWAGDGSHRIPMMSFANVIPAFDAVRLEVVEG